MLRSRPLLNLLSQALDDTPNPERRIKSVVLSSTSGQMIISTSINPSSIIKKSPKPFSSLNGSSESIISTNHENANFLNGNSFKNNIDSNNAENRENSQNSSIQLKDEQVKKASVYASFASLVWKNYLAQLKNTLVLNLIVSSDSSQVSTSTSNINIPDIKSSQNLKQKINPTLSNNNISDNEQSVSNSIFPPQWLSITTNSDLILIYSVSQTCLLTLVGDSNCTLGLMIIKASSIAAELSKQFQETGFKIE